MAYRNLLCFCLLFNFGSLPGQGTEADNIERIWRHAHDIHADSAETAKRICTYVIKRSGELGYLKGQGDAYITLGAIERNKGNFLLSYQHLNKALQIRRVLGDSNRVAAVYTNLAINQAMENRYDAAISTLLYANKLVQDVPAPDYELLGSNYLALSNICDEYLEPDDALKYALLSLNAFVKTDKASLTGMAAYALGKRYLDSDQLDTSLTYFNQAYNNYMASTKSPGMLSDILINKGVIFTKKRAYEVAEKQFDEAEILLQSMGEDVDYFFFCLNKGALMAARKEWNKALDYYRQATPEDPESLSFLEQKYLFESLAEAYSALNHPDSAYQFQKAAIVARDSIYNEFKQKEFIRSQAEQYKRETLIEQVRTQKQASRARVFLVATLLLTALIALIIYNYWQRRKSFKLIQKQKETLHKQEVDELIRQSELQYLRAGLEGRETEREQIARELHDRLGSAIVTLNWRYDALLDNIPVNSAQHGEMRNMNDSLKNLYQEVRQLAHQLGSGVLERVGLVPVLEELCQAISAGKRIEVAFSVFGLEKRLAFSMEINILRIVQELMSNILKYAGATQLTLEINRFDERVSIMIEDNGSGFDPHLERNGTGAGLANVESRLRAMHGVIQFESRPAGGTTVFIHIPILETESMYE